MKQKSFDDQFIIQNLKNKLKVSNLQAKELETALRVERE